MSAVVRAFLVESNETQIEELVGFYSYVFKLLHYELAVEEVRDHKLLGKAISEHPPHIVICDLSLGDTKGFYGLDVIRANRASYPEILFIGNTAANLSFRVSEAKGPHFSIFVDKNKTSLLIEKGVYGEPKEPAYAKNVADEIGQRFCRNVALSSLSILPAEGEERPRGYNIRLNALMEQVTFVGHESDAAISIASVALRPLQDGRSGSFVFEVIAEAVTPNVRLVPTVMKVSSIVRAKQEYSNYKRYVRWLLPFEWRPELLGFGVTRDHGAVLYSFAGDRDTFSEGGTAFDSALERTQKHEIHSLAALIERGQYSMVSGAIQRIFSPNGKSWYSEAVCTSEKGLMQRYVYHYFDERVRRVLFVNDALLEALQMYLHYRKSNDKYEALGYLWEDPHTLIHRYRSFAYVSCIQHGDMNAKNILISKDGKKIKFIDFQDTGRGHCFEDFAALELSIRVYAEPAEGWAPEDAFKSECDIDVIRPREPEYLALIRQVRLLATQNFACDMETYFYSIVAQGCRLLLIKEIKDVSRFRIACAVTAACIALTRR